jgi:hypothetical protein
MKLRARLPFPPTLTGAHFMLAAIDTILGNPWRSYLAVF